MRNRVAIVEAASRGLGRAVAEALAAEGARLVICSRSQADIQATGAAIERKYGTGVVAQVADVSADGDVKRLVEAAMAAFGQIDICVANSHGPPVKRFLETQPEDWQSAVQGNLLGTVLIAREVLPVMAQAGWGRFIAISSVVAKQPERGFVLSNAIRPGVSGLVRTLADEFGSNNITVNAVLPGTFATDRLANVSAGTGGTPDYERWIKAVPLQRVGLPEEFGATVAFLCSKQAAFITGTSMVIDGGLSRGLL